VIECGKYQHRNEAERRQHHDDLLRRFFLRARPHIHAPFEKFRIAECEVDGSGSRCASEHGHEKPCLPIIESSGRDEKKRRQRHNAEER
jgi:hypothetical protein